MAEKLVVLQNTKMSIEEETVEGTAVVETANGALLLHSDGAEFNLERDLVENAFMTGSLSKTAPAAGMWSDDLGPTIPTLIRGVGTLGTHGPDWHLLMKSLMGTELRAEAGVVDAGSTALIIQVKSGCASPAIIPGMLLYFPTQGEIRRIATYSAPAITLDIPLSSIPAEDDLIKTGVNWMLSSSDFPSFTAYTYFDGPKRLRYAGCKCTNWEATFEVGQNVPMTFASKALSALYDNTAQAITPNYDTTTKPLMCLGIDGLNMFTRYEGTASGTPSATETILATPAFDVGVGDEIQIEVSAGVWETKSISVVSGDAGSNITLTHAAVSIAASADDTVYILRGACAAVGDTLTVTVEMESEFENCMAANYGKKSQAITGRTVTLAKTPYFKSWQEFLMRDNVIGSGFMITLGDELLNIMAIYVSNQINTEVSLSTDALMKNDTTSRGVIDATLGNDHEIVIATF